MSRPAVEVADVLHAQGDHFLERHPWLSGQQRTVLRALQRWSDRRARRSSRSVWHLRTSSHFVQLVSQPALSEVSGPGA